MLLDATMDISVSNELQQLQMELRAQNFDIIRFSTYRTACKLRFIQKKLNFHLLDLLNVNESLRESLARLSSEPHSTSALLSWPNNTKLLSIHHLTQFLTSIYTNLNKRLPLSQQILHIENCVQSAVAWFLSVYNINKGSIRFNSFRVVLLLLCTGKLIDKMRYIFLLYSSASTLTYDQIDELLHEILALPYALREISQTSYRKSYASSIFAHVSSPVSVDDFLEIFIYENPTPNCLQWLIIFHRLISVENVIHRVQCSACQRASFSGFRYKCQECPHRTYQLCQDCFWRGRTSDRHLPTHEMKEYTYFLSPNKDFRQSLRKSFHCTQNNEKHQQVASPLTIDQEQRVFEQIVEKRPRKVQPDEHQLIALYTEQLAMMTEKEKFRSLSNQCRSRKEHITHPSAEKKLIISKLEAENRRILHEINTLRTQLKHRSLDRMDCQPYGEIDGFSTIEQECTRTLPVRRSNHRVRMKRAGSVETPEKSAYFEHELQSLLTHKYKLESRIEQLQQSREELTSHIDQLGRISRYTSCFHQPSTLSSPRFGSSISPCRITSTSGRCSSTPSSPIPNRLSKNLRTDLLLAADSLTTAMSSLVRQLNIERAE